jgi:hypothetical protein
MSNEFVPRKTDCEKVSDCGKYGVHNGRLYRLGKHGYEAGHIMDPENIECAVDAAEEEMRVMMAEARAEFGC